MSDKSFFETTQVGDQIPTYHKKAIIKELFMTWGKEGDQLHPLFGGTHLVSDASEAATRAKAKDVDPIHFASMLPGTHALEFISQMITNWLPHPAAWLYGGKLNAKFIGLIKPNEEISCKGRVSEKRLDTKQLVCDIWIENSQGDKMVIADVTLQF